MQLPILSLNGTKRECLVEDLCGAASAVRIAIEVLGKCSPNGRDYIGEPAALSRATIEHWGRRERLCSVLSELEQLAEQITDLGA